jgi:hypothetical protein
VTDEYAWPDAVEEVGVHDARDPQQQTLDEYVAAPTSADPEDLAYLLVMRLLEALADGSSCILALSDRVTNHMVSGIGFFVRGRSYRIIFHDSWGPGQSFLQLGKNMAGVAAEPYKGGGFSVSHHELTRVLDSFIGVAKQEQADDGKDAQN